MAEHLGVWDVEGMLDMALPQWQTWQAYYRRKETLRRQEELAAKASAAVDSRVQKGRR